MGYKSTNEVILSRESVQKAIQMFLNEMLYETAKVHVQDILYYKKSGRVKAIFVPRIEKKQADDAAAGIKKEP